MAEWLGSTEVLRLRTASQVGYKAKRARSGGEKARLALFAHFSLRPKTHSGACSQTKMS